MALEHDGGVYSCDHYVYPSYFLGNIVDKSLEEMISSPAQVKFGNDKWDTLPKYCRECEFLFTCNGGCPKHRFANTPDGAPGLNYLCAGYKKFFKHIDPTMREMAALIQTGRPAADIIPDLGLWVAGLLCLFQCLRKPDRWGATSSVRAEVGKNIKSAVESSL